MPILLPSPSPNAPSAAATARRCPSHHRAAPRKTQG